MSLYGFPVLFALFIWWFSTGVIVYLDGLQRGTHRWTLLGTSIAAIAALLGLWASREDTSVAGAYCAFTCGLIIWGWQEVSFLMGPVTGPRKHACAPGCSGVAHFFHAAQTIAYHELAILISGITMLAITWNAPNQLGTWIFMVLWFMRASAKLNVFLGVRNLSEEFLPAHLKFLETYFTRKPMNLFFPISITVAMVAATVLVQRAIAVDASDFTATAYTFTATMMALAILEHWFLVVPLPSTALWSWSLKSRPQNMGTERVIDPHHIHRHMHSPIHAHPSAIRPAIATYAPRR